MVAPGFGVTDRSVGAAGANGPTGPPAPESALLELARIPLNATVEVSLCQHDLFSHLMSAARRYELQS